jgi:formamidopyrimidine-DNA glycosylase
VPEGDTVWLAAQRMHTALAGATLRRGEFRIAQLATVDLAGATVREVVPRGKHLLIRLADDRTLRTHFRMDGSWHIYRASSSAPASGTASATGCTTSTWRPRPTRTGWWAISAPTSSAPTGT